MSHCEVKIKIKSPTLTFAYESFQKGTTSVDEAGEFEVIPLKASSPHYSLEKRSSYNASKGAARVNFDFEAFGSKFSLRLAKNDYLITPRYVLF